VTAGPPTTERHRDLLHEARRALGQVAAAERRYLDQHPYRPVHQYDPRAERYTIRIHVTTHLPAELPTLAGQVLGGARASLDALATALATPLASAPPAEGATRAVRFPIHESLPEFAQRSRRAIGTMSDEAQATIEEVQPYHTFGGFQKDALWLLRELGLAERPALAAGALRDESEVGVNTRRHVEIVGDLRVVPGVFEDGAVVVDVAAKVVGRDPKLDLYFRPSVQLAFAAQGPARGAALVPALTAICDRVEAVGVALRG
jgi:hypothetical protein